MPKEEGLEIRETIAWNEHILSFGLFSTCVEIH